MAKLGTTSDIHLAFEFSRDSAGWTGGFADFNPDGADYKLACGLRPLPAPLDSSVQAFYLQGMNRSDDLFMYLTRRCGVENGLQPNTEYALTFDVSLASDAPTGAMGVGGAPGEAVVLKVGASVDPPVPVYDKAGIIMTIDKGHQNNDGSAASVIGDMANGRSPEDARQYVLINRSGQHRTPVRSNEKGELWLIVGTESGFEGFTGLYYTSINVTLSVASNT